MRGCVSTETFGLDTCPVRPSRPTMLRVAGGFGESKLSAEVNVGGSTGPCKAVDGEKVGDLR